VGWWGEGGGGYLGDACQAGKHSFPYRWLAGWDALHFDVASVGQRSRLLLSHPLWVSNGFQVFRLPVGAPWLGSCKKKLSLSV
jgi:hypothetical protein